MVPEVKGQLAAVDHGMKIRKAGGPRQGIQKGEHHGQFMGFKGENHGQDLEKSG
jgi:hypothetical protein